jgi:hypothetical protein
MQYFLLPHGRTARAALLLFCASAFLGAQTPVSQTVKPATADTSNVGQESPPASYLKPAEAILDEAEPDFPLATPQSLVEQTPKPLDFHGKVNYFMRSAFSPQSLGRMAFTTGLSQLGVSDVWGGGLDGFQDHLQSRYYEHLTRRGIQFGFAVARGEDPRFYRSQREGFWNRTKFVLSRTVLTQMDDGSTSVAVGRLAGIAGGNFASAYWRPDHPEPWKHTLSNSAVNIGGDIAMRMVREFWPDIRRTFLKKK